MEIVTLMSTYNGEHFIREQIDSILVQEGCEVTLLVRDDGSSDGTCAILQEYMDRGLLRWYTGRNLGPARSFLDLVMQAPEADYYAFADQDDIWDSDKLATGMECLKDYQGPACYGANSRLVDINGASMNILTDRRAKSVVRPLNCLLSALFYGGITGCTMVMNRALIATIQRYGVPDKVIMHDLFIQQICRSLGGVLLFDGRPHMGYRQHGRNTVGVQITVLQKICGRIRGVVGKKSVTADEVAAEILRLYEGTLPTAHILVLRRVANYRRNIFTRLSLACSPKFRNLYFVPGLCLRLSLLWGNI